MALLGVNIDHVATLREARKIDYPDPIEFAKLSEKLAVDQITCHLREDRRHIQDEDLKKLKESINIPLNLEMAATDEMKRIALASNPEKITLVPEKREEVTTEGGLNLNQAKAHFKEIIKELSQKNIVVSVFIDPEKEQILTCQELEIKHLEFNTGSYCNATEELREHEIEKLRQACQFAEQLDMFIAAGHGLNYHNIHPLKNIKEIKEFNIGHSIVAHALMVGWERAILEMKTIVENI